MARPPRSHDSEDVSSSSSPSTNFAPANMPPLPPPPRMPTPGVHENAVAQIQAHQRHDANQRFAKQAELIRLAHAMAMRGRGGPGSSGSSGAS